MDLDILPSLTGEGPQKQATDAADPLIGFIGPFSLAWAGFACGFRMGLVTCKGDRAVGLLQALLVWVSMSSF